MSDTMNLPAENGGENKGGEAGKTYTPPATQEELNRIIEARLARERAKFADYEDLKRKAARLEQIEREQMSEADRLRRELEEERALRLKVERESLVNRIAAEKGVPAHLLTGETEADLLASADALIEFRENAGQKPRRGAVVPNEGRQPGESADANSEALRILGF